MAYISSYNLEEGVKSIPFELVIITYGACMEVKLTHGNCSQTCVYKQQQKPHVRMKRVCIWLVQVASYLTITTCTLQYIAIASYMLTRIVCLTLLHAFSFWLVKRLWWTTSIGYSTSTVHGIYLTSKKDRANNVAIKKATCYILVILLLSFFMTQTQKGSLVTKTHEHIIWVCLIYSQLAYSYSWLHKIYV